MSRIVTMGEILLRFTPPDYTRLKESDMMKMTVGGAELNTAAALSNFNHSVALLSALPESGLSEKVRHFMRSRNIDDQFVSTKEGRMGIYFVEEGYGLNSSKVTYDRAHSSMLMLKEEDLYWDQVFSQCDLFHLSGITPALSEDLKQLSLTALKEARKRNIMISFDCNYRSKLWTSEEAGVTFEEILPFVDICFAGQKDFSHLLKWGAEEPFNENKLEEYFNKASQVYGISVFACTNRKVIHSQLHKIQAFIYMNQELMKTDEIAVNVLDRIGSGDSFAAGVIHKVLTGKGASEAVEFALAANILKHSVKGDHNTFSETEITEWMENQLQKDVSR